MFLKILNFTKIRPAGLELFHANWWKDTQTDRQTEKQTDRQRDRQEDGRVEKCGKVNDRFSLVFSESVYDSCT